jgi:hypothetical protein
VKRDPYRQGNPIRGREAFQLKEVVHRMRHGVHTNGCGRDRTEHPLAGHRCGPENHGQGRAELKDTTDQVLGVRREQRDPCAS